MPITCSEKSHDLRFTLRLRPSLLKKGKSRAGSCVLHSLSFRLTVYLQCPGA